MIIDIACILSRRVYDLCVRLYIIIIIVCATDEPFLVHSGHEPQYYYVYLRHIAGTYMIIVYPCVRIKRVTVRLRHTSIIVLSYN